MKPGPELDALVAEKVMGWRLERTACVDGCTMAWLKPKKSGALEMVGCDHSLPKFSTDISDAWTLVNAVIEGTSPMKKFLFQLRRRIFFFLDCFSNQWFADFYDDIGRKFHHSARAETAPLAICLAALKVRGHRDIQPRGTPNFYWKYL